MKTMIRISGICLLSLLMALTACERAAQPLDEETGGEHTCVLRLAGGVIPFDGGTKASGDFTYSSENRLYIRLQSGNRVISGSATYVGGSDPWTFSYSGSLSGVTSGTAQVVLFENNTNVRSAFLLECSFRTPIYEDAAGSFTLADEILTIRANLSPKTGRIQFFPNAGEQGKEVSYYMSGIRYVTAFNLADFTFQTSDAVDYYYQSNGSDYFYGVFADPEDPTLALVYHLDNYGECFFYRHFAPGIMQPGQSGYINHPTEDLSGWRKYKRWIESWIDGQNGSNGRWINFTFVPSGTFRMGNDADETASPAHDVTLKPYYIGRYEVTRDVWYNVMGEPSDWANNYYPVTDRSYEDIQAFITALNSFNDDTRSYRFRLPTEAEWEFAARGGIFSKGYTYSGGNTLRDVAVRNQDMSVGSRTPNELDLYDMSGDVAELCSDWYGKYVDQAMTNPTGPASGDFRVVRGGYVWDGEERMTVWHRSTTEDYGIPSGAIGFRLVIEAPVIDKN